MLAEDMMGSWRPIQLHAACGLLIPVNFLGG